jgi:hypothetical protein
MLHRVWVWLAVVTVLTLSGCVNIPDSYAPPIQRKPLTAPQPGGLSHIINMNDPNVLAHIVRDISPNLEGGVFRWAYRRPEMRFALTSTTHLKFVMDFALPAANFEQTGPVTISFYVNDHLLDRVRYDTPGRKTFEKEVPAEWLRTDALTLVATEIDKMYVSPQDGTKLGFPIIRVGFIE